jgi:hypothetical protein
MCGSRTSAWDRHSVTRMNDHRVGNAGGNRGPESAGRAWERGARPRPGGDGFWRADPGRRHHPADRPTSRPVQAPAVAPPPSQPHTSGRPWAQHRPRTDTSTLLPPSARRAERLAVRGVPLGPAPRGGKSVDLFKAPLGTWGVTIVLLAACLAGAALDLLLVGTAAWAVRILFLGATCYAAGTVRRTDWYAAVVGPPLAFAGGLLVVAVFSPHDLGRGAIAVCATMLELLALNSGAVFLGTGAAIIITLVRRFLLRR